MQNVQLHSEAAALLLIWAANQIKLYACHKKLGPPPEVSSEIKPEEVNRATNKTKVILKAKKDEEDQQKKQDAAKAMLLKKEGLSKPQQTKEKAPTLGHFVQSKKAVLDESAGIGTELVKEEQKNQKLVDISVIRRGLNFHGANDRDLKQEREDILKEEELQEREKTLASKTTIDKKEKPGAVKQEVKAKAAEEDDREGKLKMIEVQNLPDDVDMIVGNLKALDFSI